MSFSAIRTASLLLLKRYHTFMINELDCWHPEDALLQALCKNGHLSASGVGLLLCHLFILGSFFHGGFHSPDCIIHYVLFPPSLVLVLLVASTAE